jgi:hypothetical protein
LIASLASVAVLIGGVLSLIANGVIFWIWGLNFFQIASPSDLIMSGSLIAGWLILVICGTIVFSLIPAFISFSLDMITHRVVKQYLPNSIIVSGKGVFSGSFQLSVIYLIMTCAFCYMLIFDYWSWPWVRFLAFGTAFAIAYTLIPIIISNITEIESPREFLIRRAIIVATFLLIACTELVIYFAVNTHPTMVGKVDGLRCFAPLRVVWVGTETVVLRCGPNYRPVRSTDHFFIVARDSVMLEKAGR